MIGLPLKNRDKNAHSLERLTKIVVGRCKESCSCRDRHFGRFADIVGLLPLENQLLHQELSFKRTIDTLEINLIQTDAEVENNEEKNKRPE